MEERLDKRRPESSKSLEPIEVSEEFAELGSILSCSLEKSCVSGTVRSPPSRKPR